MSKHAFTLTCSLAVLVAVLAAWQWLPGLLGTPEYIWPKFTSVVEEFFRMWNDGNLAEHFSYTALEVVLGFILGALLGLFVGVVLGLSPTTESVLSPYILACKLPRKWHLLRCS